MAPSAAPAEPSPPALLQNLGHPAPAAPLQRSHYAPSLPAGFGAPASSPFGATTASPFGQTSFGQTQAAASPFGTTSVFGQVRHEWWQGRGCGRRAVHSVSSSLAEELVAHAAGTLCVRQADRADPPLCHCRASLRLGPRRRPLSAAGLAPRAPRRLARPHRPSALAAALGWVTGCSCMDVDSGL